MTENDLKQAYDIACAYPNTTPDMFKDAALIRIDSREVVINDDTRRTLINTSSYSRQLQGTNIALPTYNIQLPGSEAKSLNDRIAILGIGSNCSPEVLLNKFQKAGIGGEFYLAQVTLPKTCVAHSAFAGAKGTVPATAFPEADTESYITVGFYTPEQAEALTGTEANYDLVQKSGPIHTWGLDNNPVLAQGALLYVSIWGAITEDGKTPVLQAGIPQTSSLIARPTSWAITNAARITGYGEDVIRFVDNLKPGFENLEHRLNHTLKIHSSHSLAAVIEGQKVKDATLHDQVKKLPAPPMLPRITYL